MKIEIKVHTTDERGNILTLGENLMICWNRRTFLIPKGFESDGVSTPRFLWSTISPAIHPQTIRAGIAHDWIYRTQPEEWTRGEADKMFYDLCREDGFSWWRALKAYWGLCMFGDKAWMENAAFKDERRNEV